MIANKLISAVVPTEKSGEKMKKRRMKMIENGMLLGRYGDSEKEEHYCSCSWCSAEIMYGDDYYDLDDDKVCTECMEWKRRKAE
jgi:hypothetical protein